MELTIGISSLQQNDHCRKLIPSKQGVNFKACLPVPSIISGSVYATSLGLVLQRFVLRSRRVLGYLILSTGISLWMAKD